MAPTNGILQRAGINVKEYKQEVLNNKLGYIPQRAVMFTGSVNENVSYGDNGKEEISEEKIECNFEIEDNFKVKFNMVNYDLNQVLKIKMQFLFEAFKATKVVDRGNSIAVDNKKCIYITGVTSIQKFPEKRLYKTIYSEKDYSAYIIKINSRKSGQAALEYGAYLGGNRVDEGVSIAVDYSGVVWDKVQRNGIGEEIKRDKNCNFHNIAIMVTTRFTYLHSKYVLLYSGLGVGLNINTGSEIDYRDRKTALAPALNLTVLGMSVGNEKWYGAVEFGGLYSLMNIQEVYLAGSRMFTLSVGCRF